MANSVTTFLSEVKTELKKVVWPSRDELKAATLVVLIATFLLAVYIGIVDFIFSKLITLIIR
ncbi:MAG: preprotein translocase subunit SecE [Candidatus Omnitrophica bacterium]|nr:preprotein translocase subunit SecE [Candidatus Omnitrophota bacterium]